MKIVSTEVVKRIKDKYADIIRVVFAYEDGQYYKDFFISDQLRSDTDFNITEYFTKEIIRWVREQEDDGDN